MEEELRKVRGQSERQEKKLTEEIECLKTELDNLEVAYKTEKQQFVSLIEEKEDQIRQMGNELVEVTQKYETVLR